MQSATKLQLRVLRCEERSDGATRRVIQDGLGCVASLAMTIEDETHLGTRHDGYLYSV